MITLRENYSLKKHNSFGIDSRTRYFAEVDNVNDLITLLKNNPARGLQFMILGEGTNILFVDDFDGMILHPKITGIEITRETDDFIYIRVSAGENWDRFIGWAVKKELGGIENLSLIPGSVGACPVQNIGAYGCEVSEVIEHVETIRVSDGIKKVYQNKSCNFGYRSSIFKTKLQGQVIITHVLFRLSKKPLLKTEYGAISEKLKNYSHPTVSDLREVIIGIRSEKLPDPQKTGNAGSFFKNPVLTGDAFRSFINKYPDAPHFQTEVEDTHKIPAAWLIEYCGWKGKRLGNAGIYEFQPLVIVNYGDATGREIFELSEKIRKDVFSRFNIMLETEVNLVGVS